MEFQWLPHGRAEHLPMPLLGWLPYALARAGARATPPDVVPPYTIRSRENLLAALRAGARTRGTSRCTPPTVPPYTIRSPETSFPPLPAPRYTDARPTMPPYTIRSRETPNNVLPTLPALRTRARAPCRGARPVSLANVDARLRRAGFFIGCSEIKKKILKHPPHICT